MIADADLMKSVLETSRLLTSPYKAEHPSDTESEPGLSSEDKAEGLPPHRAVARRLPAHHGGALYQLPAPQPTPPSAATGT